MVVLLHLDGDAQARAAHGSLRPQALQRLHEAPGGDCPEFDLAGLAVRFVASDDTPAVVVRLHDRDALAEDERRLVGEDGREQLSDALHLEALPADGGRPGGGEHRGNGDVLGVAAGGCMRDGVAGGGEDGATLSWGRGRREACCRRRERGGGDAIIFVAVRCHHMRWGRKCIEGGVRRIERELEWCEWLGKIALFFIK